MSNLYSKEQKILSKQGGRIGMQYSKRRKPRRSNRLIVKLMIFIGATIVLLSGFLFIFISLKIALG